VAELLDGVALRSPLGLLIEDVHWADGATLDFLTYFARVGRGGAVSVVVTCRSDEVPLDGAVAVWLEHVRRDTGVAEIRVGPLSRSDVAEQVAALVGAAPPGELVEEVYARTEGHAFFTEQLVAAAVTDAGELAQAVELPPRLAELLLARTARCGGDGQAVLAALVVAGRPLTEVTLGEVTGLDASTVRTAVRDLTAARLLGAPADRGHRPRHALLAEAVAAELLPGEQVVLHERIAQSLQAMGDDALAAEAAGHWAAAGRSGAELQARLTAARAAEQVFAYADAAAHWQRAIELSQAEPGADLGDGLDVPRLYIRAVDALDASGDSVRAGAVAEEAYRRFADHADRATAAVVHQRAAYLRAIIDSPAAGLPLIKEALRLYDGSPPSAEHASAWFQYTFFFLIEGGGRHQEEILAALTRGLEIAKAAGAATLIPRILSLLAIESFERGEVEEGFRLLAQARSEPEASRDASTVIVLAANESSALLTLGRLEAGTRTGLRGFDDARKLGFGSNRAAILTLTNGVEGLLGRGRTAEAAALLDPLTGGPVDRDNRWLHQVRAEIDLLRGQVEAAARRLRRMGTGTDVDDARELGQRVAEVALWAGRPEQALEAVQRALQRLEDTDWGTISCGWLLAAAMRACADLSEQARARDEMAVRAALAAADDLVSWVNREHDVPFTDHPYVAIIPAARATWDAERSRAAGSSNAELWSGAADQWEALDYRHRAAYARWRQAEALLATPHGRGTAATVLSTAAGLAVEHVPLTAAIQNLARSARIDLDAGAEPAQPDEPSVARAFGLTDRELDVLRLLGQGKTNPEIAAALFISPRTAGVHVTHILRKLDATTRVQAATIADRAGLLDSGQADTPLAQT
jgi:DNA-binding CsgD family transcriptional regulator